MLVTNTLLYNMLSTYIIPNVYYIEYLYLYKRHGTTPKYIM